MIRFLTRLYRTASRRDARQAIVIGCALFAFLWHFLPRTPAARDVVITVPGHAAPPSGPGARFEGPAGGGRQSVRRFRVPLTSPRLAKLKAMAAERHRPEHHRLPLRYYAAKWRLTAAQYYYECELQRERSVEKRPNQLAPTDPAPPRSTVGSNSIAPVSFDAPARSSSAVGRYGSAYWDGERRRAESDVQRFLAELPPAGASPGAADVQIGAVVPGRPTTLAFLGAVAAAAFGACIVARLQRDTISADGPAPCQPSLQLELPSHWFRQAPPRRERWARWCTAAAWLTVVLSAGFAWLR